MTSFLGLPAFSGFVCYADACACTCRLYVPVVAKLDICTHLKLFIRLLCIFSIHRRVLVKLNTRFSRNLSYKGKILTIVAFYYVIAHPNK